MKLVIAIAFALLACGKPNQAPASAATIRLLSVDDRVLVQLAPDDRLLDATGTPIGRYDRRAGTIAVGSDSVSLAGVVKDDADGSYTLGTWRVRVGAGGDVTVDGTRFGRLDGLGTSPDAQRRGKALLAAVPMLPTPAKPAPDAAIEAEPPPPPPPPHPHE